MDYFSKEAIARRQWDEAGNVLSKAKDPNLEERIKIVSARLIQLRSEAQSTYDQVKRDKCLAETQILLGQLRNIDEMASSKAILGMDRKEITRHAIDEMFKGNFPSMTQWDVDMNAKGIAN